MKFYNICLNQTPLHLAIEMGKMNIIKTLITSNKIDPNIKCVFYHLILNKILKFKD